MPSPRIPDDFYGLDPHDLDPYGPPATPGGSGNGDSDSFSSQHSSAAGPGLRPSRTTAAGTVCSRPARRRPSVSGSLFRSTAQLLLPAGKWRGPHPQFSWLPPPLSPLSETHSDCQRLFWHGRSPAGIPPTARSEPCIGKRPGRSVHGGPSIGGWELCPLVAAGRSAPTPPPSVPR
jgi:hypothetical protein